ncbi:hypothetical protein KS43_21620 [Pectobacterium odoriferum]|nr:hypothetical protein KS43_21620 [Pectobacterium odoriferum]
MVMNEKNRTDDFELKIKGVIKNTQVTKKQHYVFRHYLSAWAKKDKKEVKTWCLFKENHKIEYTSIKNTAQKRYFYEVKSLTDLEKLVVFLTCYWSERVDIGENPNFMLNINELWSDFEGNIIDSLGRELVNEFFDKKRKQIGEDIQCEYERMGIDYLNNLMQDNCDFYLDERCRISFGMYFFMQYVRTNRMKKRIVSNVDFLFETRAEIVRNLNRFESMLSEQSIKIDMRKVKQQMFEFSMNVNIDKIAPYCLDNMAQVMTKLFTVMHPMKLSLVRAPGGTRFITSDQPIVNILSDSEHNDIKGHDFYYPLSPTLAISLTPHHSWSVERIKINQESVVNLNRKMYEFSDSQVYALDKNDFNF